MRSLGPRQFVFNIVLMNKCLAAEASVRLHCRQSDDSSSVTSSVKIRCGATTAALRGRSHGAVSEMFLLLLQGVDSNVTLPSWLRLETTGCKQTLLMSIKSEAIEKRDLTGASDSSRGCKRPQVWSGGSGAVMPTMPPMTKLGHLAHQSLIVNTFLVRRADICVFFWKQEN